VASVSNALNRPEIVGDPNSQASARLDRGARLRQERVRARQLRLCRVIQVVTNSFPATGTNERIIRLRPGATPAVLVDGRSPAQSMLGVGR
jgi:hypothetical protein